MEQIAISPMLLVAGMGVLLVGALLWSSGARRARAAADVARSGARAVSLAGRVLLLAAVIAGAELVVITYALHNVTLVGVVLGLPALFTAHTVVKAVTVVGDGGGRGRRGGGKR